MELPYDSVIGVLTFLLPGFVAASVVYSLTPSPKPVPFERTIQALIFTIVVQALVVVIKATATLAGRAIALGAWTAESSVTVSVLTALLLGVVWARLLNNDGLHALLRHGGFTHQTSYSSEWYGVLPQNKQYIVLHLKGSRRLYGWPEEWPSTPGQGHFVIAQPEWLDGESVIPATGVAKILVPAVDVEMVELMLGADSTNAEINNGRQKATDTTATIATWANRRGEVSHAELTAGNSPATATATAGEANSVGGAA